MAARLPVRFTPNGLRDWASFQQRYRDTNPRIVDHVERVFGRGYPPQGSARVTLIGVVEWPIPDPLLEHLEVPHDLDEDGDDFVPLGALVAGAVGGLGTHQAFWVAKLNDLTVEDALRLWMHAL